MLPRRVGSRRPPLPYRHPLGRPLAHPRHRPFRFLWRQQPTIRPREGSSPPPLPGAPPQLRTRRRKRRPSPTLPPSRPPMPRPTFRKYSRTPARPRGKRRPIPVQAGRMRCRVGRLDSWLAASWRSGACVGVPRLRRERAVPPGTTPTRLRSGQAAFKAGRSRHPRPFRGNPTKRSTSHRQAHRTFRQPSLSAHPPSSRPASRL